MVASIQQAAPKPNLDEIKKMAAAAVFGVQNAPESKDGVSGAGQQEENDQKSNGVALNGSSPPPAAAVPAGYSQTGENFIGVPPSQVVPNTSFPSLPPPEVARTIPCRFWPNCSYADKCAFAHDPQLAPASAAAAPSGPSPVPALPTPQDSPTTSSPPQMMPSPQQQGVHQAMMGGFYYPYPQPNEHMPMQDFYGMSSPPPFQPMHQPYFYPHAPQFQSPPPQQAPLDPRAQYPAYGYPSYPQERQPSPMHAGVPTAPRAQQQAQKQQSTDESISTSPQDQTSEPSQAPDSTSAEQANGHTFFQTQPYTNEAVMNASGIPPSRQFTPEQRSLSSSANRRTSSLPGSAFSSSKPRFTHPRHAMPCTFFTTSKCRNGDSCPFAHIMADGSDAKALGKDIVGPNGAQGDPHVLESFRRSEGARRDTIRFEKNNAPRVRQETYPGASGIREGRFGLAPPGKEAPRGRFGSSQVGQEAGKEASARPASLPGVARANQRVPNGADFPALPAPTTPVSEKVAEFPSQESDKSEEAPASEIASPPSETVEEPHQKLSFSFASAAARGASVPPPQKKSHRQQVNHNHSDNHRSADKAPMQVAVA